MEILTIAFREDLTIIAKFLKKKKTFLVKNLFVHDSVMHLLEQDNPSELTALIEKMVVTAEGSKCPIYITLPSSYCRQDYWVSDLKVPLDMVDMTKLHTWVNSLLQKELAGDYYISLPMVQRYEKTIFVSGVGIEKKYIDRINAAFINNDFDLASIEIEAVAYIRAIANWKANYILIDINEYVSNITAYCAKIGMYTYTIPMGRAMADAPENLQSLIDQIELAEATWNFKDSNRTQLFLTGDVHKILKQLRSQREDVLTIPIPNVSNSDKFNSRFLILPIGIVSKELYREGVDLDESANHEFAAVTNGTGSQLQAAKRTAKQVFSKIGDRFSIANFRRGNNDRL